MSSVKTKWLKENREPTAAEVSERRNEKAEAMFELLTNPPPGVRPIPRNQWPDRRQWAKWQRELLATAAGVPTPSDETWALLLEKVRDYRNA